MTDSKEHLRYSPRPERDGMKSGIVWERKSESMGKQRRAAYLFSD